MSLVLHDICKSYGKQQALQNVSLELEEGVIYALLGRNGAGKSTLLKIVTGQIWADAGEILMDGGPVIEKDLALSRMYLMSDKKLYPDAMRIKDALKWTSQWYPDYDAQTAQRLVKAFGLSMRQRIGELSTGYTSIYKLIIALSCGAPYIFLDEPVLGLDAAYRDLFYKELLNCYMRYQPTIVISTHLIDEIAGIVEKVIILKNGEILRNTTCEEMLQEGYTISGPRNAVESYIQGKQVLGTDILGGLMSAYISGNRTDETVPVGLEIAAMDLQKLFIKLTEEDGI